jgi:nucleotide-binding universal stress UspA family protein
MKTDMITALTAVVTLESTPCKPIFAKIATSACARDADKALDFALDLAEKYSATITLVNVFQVPIFGYLGEPFADPAFLAEFTDEVKRAKITFTLNY